jgi:hypothetical protein
MARLIQPSPTRPVSARARGLSAPSKMPICGVGTGRDPMPWSW